MNTKLQRIALEINRREIALAVLRREIACMQAQREGRDKPRPIEHDTDTGARIRAMVNERMAARDGV